MNAILQQPCAEPRSLTEALDDAELRLLEPRYPASYREFDLLLERMQGPASQAVAREATDRALRLCQRLYANARSFDALPFARAALALGGRADDPVRMRRAHTACGLLLADTADVPSALEQHVMALKLAANTGDPSESGGVWNNIGIAIYMAGNAALAAVCFRRVLALLESTHEPVLSRYTAYLNLSLCHYHLHEFEEGISCAGRALAEEAGLPPPQDRYSKLLLHRNCIHLLHALNRRDDASRHLAAALELAAGDKNVRGAIAIATMRGACEVALGEHDIGLTRLERALDLARTVPATLRDTLVSVIRAEEIAGNPERAMLRMQELSEHVYRIAVGRIRQHVELSEFLGAITLRLDQPFEQTRARLSAKLAPPAAPGQWKTLQRLTVGAALRFDKTGWQGVRVGALTRSLALAYGCAPMEALEIGLAAQVHDIGMASVPERVLMKNGALNDVERALVRRHVDAGADMVSGDSHPRMLMARDIIRYHHARWDGEGYPQKVAGKSIPLAARMCAVADTYDSLVTDRPYRPARSMDEAMRELRQAAGSQLDPELVACFDVVLQREMANEGIEPDKETGMESFQQLIQALTEDKGFL